MLLRVRDLKIDYVGVGATNHSVLGVSFDVDFGEIVGVVGESGSGKSSAILGVLGLTRGNGQIAGGSVFLEDVDLLGISEGEWEKVRGAKIGLVTQNPRASLNPVLRVGEQIAQIYRVHTGADKAKARERALGLLRMVGINDPDRRYEAYPHELSGGMAQRVLIAAALSCEPILLIADEPTSGLDPTVQAQVLDDLRRAASEVGSSVLLVTHDLGIVANYCDRIYLLDTGEVVEEATTEQFFQEPAHPAGIALLSTQEDVTESSSVQLRGRPPDRLRLPSGCYLHPRCPFADEGSGCMSSHPPLYDIGFGHRSRCHRYDTVLLAARERHQTDD